MQSRTSIRPAVPGDNGINVVGVVKGEERYVILYDDQRRVEALRMIGRWAANPELSFTWYDAWDVSMQIRGRQSE